MSHKNREPFWSGVVKSMGLVFGDIGTSPIYTLTVIFSFVAPTWPNVVGILSCVIWTLILLVGVEYAWLAMSLGRKGEGGTIVLREILVRILQYGRGTALVGILSFVGVSLLMGDGVITPAISILSAVEGLLIVPGFESLSRNALLLAAAAIAISLFIFQNKGTDKVAAAFGPIMAFWFVCLLVTGIISLAEFPGVLSAISPHHVIAFFRHNGLAGFFILSEVILCATGGEALYADMGHLGRRPIIRAWFFVFIALAANYLGQGAYLYKHPEAKNFLFGMVQHQSPVLYIPFLILTISATVIASQALISGVFSIVYQGITTRIMPLLKVDYTSRILKSQIYIGSVNWTLMVLVIFIMVLFRRSENLAAAYGLAVTGTMTITGIMITWIYSRTYRKWRVPVALAVTVIDAAFLIACLSKIPHGGYWSLILAAFPLAVILLWTKGQRRLHAALRPLEMDTFLYSYNQIYSKGRIIPGTAVFFSRDVDLVPPYIVHCMFHSGIVYERNIFISIIRLDEPFSIQTDLREGFAPGLDIIHIKAGYMEMIDLEALLKQYGISEKVMFYGMEDIATSNVAWKLFYLIKKVTPHFVQFHKLPPRKLQGVVTRVEM